MDQSDMWHARGEAERFVSRVRAFDIHLKDKDGKAHRDHYACPDRAAVLRASLDLTRALARLRAR